MVARAPRDENCAFIGFNGAQTWFDGPCSMRAACVCEMPAGPYPPNPPPPPPMACAAGYQSGPTGKCYKRLPSTGTPAQCMARCHAEQATLPCVENEAQNNALVTMAGTNAATCGFTSQRNCVWIGLRQTVTTQGAGQNWNAWDGTCPSTYRNWQPGEPNDWGGSGAGSGDRIALSSALAALVLGMTARARCRPRASASK